MKYGAPVFLNAENREKYPAIVIFPQCPKDSYWSSVTIDRTTKPTTFLFNYTPEANWPLQSAVDLVKSFVKEKKRIKNVYTSWAYPWVGWGPWKRFPAIQNYLRQRILFVAGRI